LTQEEIFELISEVRFHQSELNDIEVKSANKGTPQRLFEPLSAFTNSITGGVILFGLNETNNFEIVGVADVHRLQEEISNLASAEMEPPIRPSFALAEIEGKTVLAVEIFPLPSEQKPCYYKPAGLHKGSYIRVGNTNRQMTDYEIFGYVSARTQPTFDEEHVAKASIDDLNRNSLEKYIALLRKIRP